MDASQALGHLPTIMINGFAVMAARVGTIITALASSPKEKLGVYINSIAQNVNPYLDHPHVSQAR